MNDGLRLYQKFLADQTIKQMFFFDQMKKESARDTGRSAYISLKTGYNRGLGIVAEGGTLPSPGNATKDEIAIPRAYPWIACQFTEQVLKLAKQSDMVGEAASALDEEMRDAADAMSQEYNRIMYNRDASGAMARINAASPAADLQLDAEDFTPSSDADTTFSTKYLVEGDTLRSVTARTGVSESATDIVVAGFDHDNNQVKVNVVTGLADNDYLVRKGNYGLEQVGLLGAIGTNNNTYITLDRSNDSFSWFRPNIFYNDTTGDGSGTDRILTDVILQKCINRLVKRQKAKSLYLLNHPDVSLSLQQYLSAHGRYDPIANGTPVSGFDGVKVRINGKTVTMESDEYCPNHVLFFIDLTTWKFWQIGEGFQWADADGSILKFKFPADGTYVAYGMLWGYPVCHIPRRNGMLRDILVS